MQLPLHQLLRFLFLVVAVMLANIAHAQVCAAPGKDAPGTIAGVVNRYYQGNGNLAVAATTLTLGASSGAASTVTVGDKLLIIQMQGAAINTTNNERYGDNVGAAATPDTSASQANGYTALNLAGGYEYVQVATATGNVITFTPALTNAYAQNVGRNHAGLTKSSACRSCLAPPLPLAHPSRPWPGPAWSVAWSRLTWPGD
ncbi:MAG: hypothetical protein WBK51_08205 [Polaromonas sp.]